MTANDGELGDQALRAFQDNEKTIPTILTTSQKLSTGVDARNIRNIVLMRPINSMIEFKQIIGRGTRLYDGKDYFTIYDFVEAHHHFNDPEWDGEPLEPEACEMCGKYPCECIKEVCPECGERPCVCPCPDCGEHPCVCPCPKCGKYPCECPCRKCGEWPCVCERKGKARVKLADGKERTIQHMMCTTFWHPDGTPMSAQAFMDAAVRRAARLLQDEAELRALWSEPDTRKKLLQGLAEKGFGGEQLAEMQKIIDAEKSDLFDVLAHVAYALPPETREERAARAQVADPRRVQRQAAGLPRLRARALRPRRRPGARPGEARAAAQAALPRLHRRRDRRPRRRDAHRPHLRRLPEVPVPAAATAA